MPMLLPVKICFLPTRINDYRSDLLVYLNCLYLTCTKLISDKHKKFLHFREWRNHRLQAGMTNKTASRRDFSVRTAAVSSNDSRSY